MRRILPFVVSLGLLLAGNGVVAATVAPDVVLAAAPAGGRAMADPALLLLLDPAGGGRATILFGSANVTAIRPLAQAGRNDGLAVARVQDGDVVQWGDADLDRNIALAGDMIDGLARLTALPHDTAVPDFNADPAQRTSIIGVQLADALPPAERPSFRWLRPESAWVGARADRRDAFDFRPAGTVDLFSAPPPIRAVLRG